MRHEKATSDADQRSVEPIHWICVDEAAFVEAEVAAVREL